MPNFGGFLDRTVVPQTGMSYWQVICQIFTGQILARLPPFLITTNSACSSLYTYHRVIVTIIFEFGTIFQVQKQNYPRLLQVYCIPQRLPSLNDSSVKPVLYTFPSPVVVMPTTHALLIHETLFYRSASPALSTPFPSRGPVQSPEAAPTSWPGPPLLPSLCHAPLIIGSTARFVKHLKSSEGPRNSSSSQPGPAGVSQLPLIFHLFLLSLPHLFI